MKKALKPLIAFLVITFLFVSKPLAGSDFKTVDTAQLHSMIMENAYRLEGGRAARFTVIDARTKEEYDEAHIFSAISIPEEDFEKSMNLLPQDKRALVVVYCNGTKFAKCRKLADKATNAGYANVAIYSEGFPAWKEKKMPIAPLRSDF